jgi:hypothetical protein
VCTVHPNTRPGPIQGPIKMKRRLQQIILLAIAIVSGGAPFLLAPVTAGLMLAALNVALALCAELRCGRAPN